MANKHQALADMQNSALILDDKKIAAMAMMGDVEWAFKSEFYFENLGQQQLYLKIRLSENEAWLTGPQMEWRQYKFTAEQLRDGTWWTGNADLELTQEQRLWLYTCLCIGATWLQNAQVSIYEEYLITENGR